MLQILLVAIDRLSQADGYMAALALSRLLFLLSFGSLSTSANGASASLLSTPAVLSGCIALLRLFEHDEDRHSVPSCPLCNHVAAHVPGLASCNHVAAYVGS